MLNNNVTNDQESPEHVQHIINSDLLVSGDKPPCPTRMKVNWDYHPCENKTWEENTGHFGSETKESGEHPKPLQFPCCTIFVGDICGSQTPHRAFGSWRVLSQMKHKFHPSFRDGEAGTEYSAMNWKKQPYNINSNTIQDWEYLHLIYGEVKVARVRQWPPNPQTVICFRDLSLELLPTMSRRKHWLALNRFFPLLWAERLGYHFCAFLCQQLQWVNNDFAGDLSTHTLTRIWICQNGLWPSLATMQKKPWLQV